MGILKFSVLKNRFVKDTFILMIATMVSNVFNYLYQLLMGRLLTPSEYGELFSLLSIFYIFSVFFKTINTSITRVVVVYKVNREYEKIRSVLVKTSRSLIILGALLYVLLMGLSPIISAFLHIEHVRYALVLFASIPFGLVLPLYQGVLRGLQRFGALGTSIFSWAFFKLVFGASLVVLGYGVLGGLSGVLLAHVISVLVTLFFVRDIFGYRSDYDVELWYLLRNSGFIFLAMLAYTMMWNVDVILVKHYLSPVEAGSYSAISVLGKIALFAPMAVGLVVFPKAAEKYELGEGHFHILLRGLAIAALISGAVVLAYVLFPERIITLVYGEKYLMIAPYLWKYALAMSFFSMVGVIVNYSLSVDVTEIFYLLGLSLLIEIVAIVYSASLYDIINAMVLVALLSTLVTFGALVIWNERG